MIDPARLLASEGDQALRELLAAGAAEEPPRDGAPKVAALLGVGAATLSPGPAQASVGTISKLSFAKLALAGVLVLGAGAGVLGTLSALRPAAHRPEASERALPAVREPGVAAASVAAKVAAESANAARSEPVSIADEVARLELARAALAAHKPASAARALADYDARYPEGTLRPEASRLQIEVLLAQGDARAAQAQARAFLRAYPQSPHASALRRIAEPSHGPTQTR